MPSESQLPRLSRIDGPSLAEEVVRAVVTRIQSTALQLGPGIEVRISGLEEVRAGTLYHEILDLVAWAQRGEGQPDEVHDLCLSAATACWPAPIEGPDLTPAELYSEADPETRIGLLIVAAFARERIARGFGVTPRDLATLAGIDQSQVRRLIREGELAVKQESERKQEIPAAAARRWLAGREVPGFRAGHNRWGDLKRSEAERRGRAGKR